MSSTKEISSLQLACKVVLVALASYFFYFIFSLIYSALNLIDELWVAHAFSQIFAVGTAYLVMQFIFEHLQKAFWLRLVIAVGVIVLAALFIAAKYFQII